MLDQGPVMPAPLQGERILSERRGQWGAALEPTLRDTADLPPGGNLNLTELDWLVGVGLDELRCHPLPDVVFHPIEPTAAHAPATLASWMAGYRGERLCQWTEFTATSLQSLSAGSVKVAAVTARALLELAGGDATLHRQLAGKWGFWALPAGGYDRLREIVPARALPTARGSAVLLGLAAAAVDVYVFVTNLDQGIINAFVVSTVLGFAAMLAAWVVAHAPRVVSPYSWRLSRFRRGAERLVDASASPSGNRRGF